MLFSMKKSAYKVLLLSCLLHVQSYGLDMDMESRQVLVGNCRRCVGDGRQWLMTVSYGWWCKSMDFIAPPEVHIYVQACRWLTCYKVLWAKFRKFNTPKTCPVDPMKLRAQLIESMRHNLTREFLAARL